MQVTAKMEFQLKFVVFHSKKPSGRSYVTNYSIRSRTASRYFLYERNRRGEGITSGTIA